MKIVAITPDRKFDSVAPLVIEGLRDLGHRVIASDCGNGIKKSYSDEEIVSHAKNADYIFVLWGKVRGNRPPKYYLLDRINRPEITAYVDGSEWTCTGYCDRDKKIIAPWSHGDKISLQMYEAKLDPSRCKGNPWINEKMFSYCNWYLGCLKQYFGNFKNIEKDIDIFCSYGHLYTGLRFETYEICKKLSDEGYNVVFSNKMDHEKYLKTIARSRISVSAWGAGNSCMRLWESMANKTLCFRQKTQILFPNEPEDGKHCVVYETPEEFEKKIRHYLKINEECVRIGLEGYNHVLKYHTGIPKVLSMLETMSKGR